MTMTHSALAMETSSVVCTVYQVSIEIKGKHKTTNKVWIENRLARLLNTKLDNYLFGNPELKVSNPISVNVPLFFAPQKEIYHV